MSQPDNHSRESLPDSGILNRTNSNSQIVSDVPPLSEFLGTNESPIIICDPQLGNRGKTERAQLRSIPLLQELGMNRFLYDDLWARDFQLVSHTHLNPEDTAKADLQPPLTHLVTGHQLLPRHKQEVGYEGISQAALTWQLLGRARNSDEGGQHVMVTDTENPQIPSKTPVKGRSAADHFDAIPFDYEQLMQDYVEMYVDSELPLHYTKNLFFHRLSEHHARHDAPAASLPKLFDYTTAPADSPVWNPLYHFLEHELQEVYDEYEAHVATALRSWTERGDTGKIAKKMIAVLNAQDYDSEKLAEYQHNPNR